MVRNTIDYKDPGECIAGLRRLAGGVYMRVFEHVDVFTMRVRVAPLRGFPAS